MKKRLYAVAIAAAMVPTLAAAAPIERFKGDGPSIILEGVAVPAGSDLLFLSGMLATPIDPAKTMSPSLTMADYGDTRTQTISAFNKIKSVLAKRGYTLADVIKLTVFVAGDPKLGGKMDFAGMNDGFKQFFGTAENLNTVARSTIQVAALAGPAFLVEIEATAARHK